MGVSLSKYGKFFEEAHSKLTEMMQAMNLDPLRII